MKNGNSYFTQNLLKKVTLQITKANTEKKLKNFY